MSTLTVTDLTVRYRSGKAVVHAVDGVTLDVPSGRTLGLVGESGCGKSSLARAITGLNPADDGEIRIDGTPLLWGRGSRRRRARRIQMVFQDPFGSLNPRRTIRDLVEEPLHVHRLGSRADRARAAARLLDRVGIASAMLDRLPHQLSGGQRQRVGIARALILKPEVLICDEPVSALDVSIQAQVLNLLVDLQAEMGLTMLFVSHDLEVIRYVSHTVAVMYLGRIVETGPVEDIWRTPAHPYTRALIDTTLSGQQAGRPTIVLQGELPSPLAPPSGCSFRTRCPFARDLCAEATPEPAVSGGGRLVRCHRAGEWQQELETVDA